MNIQAHVSSCLYLSGEEQPGGLAAKIPEAIYQTPVGANLKEKNISFEMKITEQFFRKSKYKLNFFLHC